MAIKLDFLAHCVPKAFIFNHVFVDALEEGTVIEGDKLLAESSFGHDTDQCSEFELDLQLLLLLDHSVVGVSVRDRCDGKLGKFRQCSLLALLLL